MAGGGAEAGAAVAADGGVDLETTGMNTDLPTTEHERAAASGVEAWVCADIAARQRLGMAKYGVSVAENPLTLREWLQHAYEECLDMAVYLRRAMEGLDAQQGEEG